MPAYSVEVESRIVGRRNDPELATVTLNVFDERLTARELIALAVEEQIRDLVLNRKIEAKQVQQILERQYLTEEEIEEQVPQGAIRYPSRPVSDLPQVSIHREINRALSAFRSGGF